MDEYTAAEAFQMWAERMRQEWQHTSFIVAHLLEVNRTKSGKKIQPDDLNPMESANSSSGGVPLRSKEGFAALKSIADRWRPKR